MRKISLAIVFFAAIAANAQQRVFVSAAHGDDTNPCSVTLPCRSFAHAIGLVFANGEILAPLEQHARRQHHRRHVYGLLQREISSL